MKIYLRFLMHHFNVCETKKLTEAPMPAKTTVLAISWQVMFVRTVSKVPDRVFNAVL